MKADELLDLLPKSNLAIFTEKDIERFIGKGKGYTALYLNRLVKRGKLTRIERGKYCLKDANIFEIAANVVYPSYISMLAAFELHGITEQKPLTIDIVTTKRHKSLEFNGYNLLFHTIKRKFFSGFYRINNQKIMCATPEKAIADSIYFKNPSENYIYEALENGLKKRIIDIRALQTFLNTMELTKNKRETAELEERLKDPYVHAK